MVIILARATPNENNLLEKGGGFDGNDLMEQRDVFFEFGRKRWALTLILAFS